MKGGNSVCICVGREDKCACLTEEEMLMGYMLLPGIQSYQMTLQLWMVKSCSRKKLLLVSLKLPARFGFFSKVMRSMFVICSTLPTKIE